VNLLDTTFEKWAVSTPIMIHCVTGTVHWPAIPPMPLDWLRPWLTGAGVQPWFRHLAFESFLEAGGICKPAAAGVAATEATSLHSLYSCWSASPAIAAAPRLTRNLALLLGLRILPSKRWSAR
jgi:hypothetical protein